MKFARFLLQKITAPENGTLVGNMLGDPSSSKKTWDLNVPPNGKGPCREQEERSQTDPFQ
jgi:hypothetical protein